MVRHAAAAPARAFDAAPATVGHLVLGDPVAGSALAKEWKAGKGKWEAADGVMRWCEEQGLGIATGADTVVPIVPAAVIYDLGVSGSARRPSPASQSTVRPTNVSRRAAASTRLWPPSSAIVA